MWLTCSLTGYGCLIRSGQTVERAVQTVQAHTAAVELGPYRHFMQKEIFEQPRAVADTLDDLNHISPELFGDGAFKIFSANAAGVDSGVWHELLRGAHGEVLDGVDGKAASGR